MDVSKNRGTPKWMVYNGKTLLKWMIWGYPYFWKHPVIASSYFQAESPYVPKKHHHFSSDFLGCFFIPSGARPRDQQQDVQHKPRYDGRITPPEFKLTWRKAGFIPLNVRI